MNYLHLLVFGFMSAATAAHAGDACSVKDGHLRYEKRVNVGSTAIITGPSFLIDGTTVGVRDHAIRKEDGASYTNSAEVLCKHFGMSTVTDFDTVNHNREASLISERAEFLAFSSGTDVITRLVCR